MMKECFSCCLLSMVIGGVIGGMIVVSSKKAENVMTKARDMAVEKIEDIKDNLEEKTKKSKTTQKQ